MIDTIRDGNLHITLPAVSGSLSLKGRAEVGMYTRVHDTLPPYEGPVTVTPTQETQVLQTRQTTLLTDITINPIPSNYGLITWDGSVLTVS